MNDSFPTIIIKEMDNDKDRAQHKCHGSGRQQALVATNQKSTHKCWIGQMWMMMLMMAPVAAKAAKLMTAKMGQAKSKTMVGVGMGAMNDSKCGGDDN
jgi:hypothetical protein